MSDTIVRPESLENTLHQEGLEVEAEAVPKVVSAIAASIDTHKFIENEHVGGQKIGSTVKTISNMASALDVAKFLTDLKTIVFGGVNTKTLSTWKAFEREINPI